MATVAQLAAPRERDVARRRPHSVGFQISDRCGVGSAHGSPYLLWASVRPHSAVTRRKLRRGDGHHPGSAKSSFFPRKASLRWTSNDFMNPAQLATPKEREVSIRPA